MKKLMIAAFAIAFAAVAQAANFLWSNYDGITGTKGDLVNGATIYLIDGSTLSQSALLTAVLGSGDVATAFSTAIASATINSATLTADAELLSPAVGVWDEGNWAANWDGTPGAAYDYYQAIVDAGNNSIYVSSSIAGVVAGMGSDDLEFTDEGASVFGPGADYTTAGWYQAAAVPEPTSALMLLVGLAGLALKRKIA